MTGAGAGTSIVLIGVRTGVSIITGAVSVTGASSHAVMLFSVLDSTSLGMIV